jgi:tetratricopeptide (TPR) repeat protein
MTDRTFLSVFTPSRTAPEDLESIFVQRQAMLDDAVERVRESALTGNKHHLLFVGPRGTGKTHFVTLLVHRLGQDAGLKKHLHIAWLNEDETSTTLLEFLIRIYLALFKRYPDDYSETSLEPIYDLSADAAEDRLASLLLQQLQSRTLLVVVENLDALFEGLGESGQQRLRAFIQEHPVLTIVATAQQLVNDIVKRNSTFFGFFQTESLKTLSVDEAAELLGKIANLNQQPDVAAFLRSPSGRSRIRALHHLSGGNHRIYIVLSQFITLDNIDALVEPFAKMIDEMTPYYQERIRWLTPQQRKIVEYLCTRERPVPVKELAKRLFTSPQSISSQLMDLRGKGYVQSVQRGRESLYEIAEPLMRICVEVKENQTSKPLRLLVDFLRVWYDTRDLSTHLQRCDDGSLAHTYLQAAIEKNSAQGNLRAQLLVEGFRSELGNEHANWFLRIKSYAQQSEELALACGEWAKGNKDRALSLLTDIARDDSQSVPVRVSAHLLAAEVHFKQDAFEQAIEELDHIPAMPETTVEQIAMALYNRGLVHKQLDDFEKAIADYSTIIDLPNAPVVGIARALLSRGLAYGQLGDSKKAIADYSAVISLPDAPIKQAAMALYNRGLAYGRLGDTEKEIADYSAVIDLPDIPVEGIARALLGRGLVYGKLGDSKKAIADYSAVINLPGAPVEQIAMTLLSRGLAYGKLGDSKKAIADYSAVINLPGAPVEQIAMALYNRGSVHRQLDDFEKTIADYSTIIDLPNAPAEQVARALYNRGLALGQLGDIEREIADYSAVIDLPDVPVEQIARALHNRGVTYGQLGDTEKEIADYSGVIDLSDAPVEQVAIALITRGVTYWQISDAKNSEQDFETIIRLAEAPIPVCVDAYLNLTGIRIATGRWDSAISTLAAGLTKGASREPIYVGDSEGIIAAFFESSLTPGIRRERTRELVQTYRDHNAIPQLGEALTRHLGLLYRDTEGLPASDSLELWASAWEEAGRDMDAFRVPLRIFRTGIDFLKAGGKDRSILLDLNQEERKLLEQVLAPEAEL